MGLHLQHSNHSRAGIQGHPFCRHRMNSDVTQENGREHNDIVVGGYQQSRKDSAF